MKPLPGPSETARPALWGGVEATVNRVGDLYLDQCRRNGHRRRLDDLDKFAEMGVSALRHAVLWETAVAEGGLGFAEAPLARLRALGVEPIVGLVHHGSGPRETNLLEASFAEGLAQHAAAVARRFPWVRDYTPVNEPLTTARFSGLYGHWYPHACCEEAFARALINECRATVLAMRAIRAINPEARLIQTEDMGVTYSTPKLAYQAEYENERRWLGFDLLLGRVDEDHPFHERLLDLGVKEEELAFFRENPTPPSVVGLDYYVTSDRFLDERLALYPAVCHGGNERQAYADTEAARARPEGITGHREILQMAWARYGIPVAFTEVHLGGAREEQLRWLKEAWNASCSARQSGVDACAVTVWSLLGAYDWNSLVTQDRGHYEPGAFDLSGGAPRPTAIYAMARGLAHEGAYHHPVIEQPGWWRRADRLLPSIADLAPSIAVGSGPTTPTTSPPSPAAPLLIVGAGGTLGRAFAIVCAARGIATRALSRAELDIADVAAVAALVEKERPWAVVNAAGYVDIDQAEIEHQRCFRENVTGPLVLAQICAAHGVPFVTFSSDLVFDGLRRAPYVESDRPSPVNTYGRSKHEAERAVLAACPSALVIRTSAFFGPWDMSNFVHHVLDTVGHRKAFFALEDVTVSPTYVPDLVHASVDLLVDGERGLWHVTNEGSVTWLELAREVASLAGFDPGLVAGQPLAHAGLSAPRPSFTPMRTERGWTLPPLSDALGRYVRERTGRTH